MKGKKFIAHYQVLLVVCCLLIVGFATACKKESKPKKIGVLNLLPTMEDTVVGFQQGLAESGYTEGKDIEFIYPGAANSPEVLETQAQELVKNKVDLIFAVTTPAALAAQKAAAGTDISVVFAAVTDPIAVGLAQSLTQPEGNVTGITVGAPGSSNEGRRLEWLQKVAPHVQVIYVPYNPDDSVVVASLAAVNQAAAKLGLELTLVEARTPEQVEAALTSIPENADALFVLADRVVVADTSRLVNITLEHGLIFCTPNSVGPEMGALLSYGSDFTAVGKQSARLAGQILKGTPAADLPIEAPEFFLILNLQTAAAINLQIPEDVLRQADTIIR